MVKMNHIFIAKLQYKLRQLSGQSRAGLLFIVISLVMLCVIARPQLQKVHELHAQLMQAKAQAAVAQRRELSAPRFDVEQAFYAVLPAQQEVNNKTAEILNAAKNAGLMPNKVEYASQPSSHSLMRYQIKLPLQGSYVQIRQFINQVLNALPTLALSDISIKREDVGSDLVQANILFTLYLRTASK